MYWLLKTEPDCGIINPNRLRWGDLLDIIKERAVCFTGHRPEKLPDGGAAGSAEVRRIKSLLYAEISEAADSGFDTFITGMQRGVDLWAGEIVMELAVKKNLHLVAVLPHRGMGQNFRDADKWTFGRIMNFAEKTVIISEKYTRTCNTDRNKFMVDNSSLVIAVVGDMSSGTGQTIRYAEKNGVAVRKIILPDSPKIITESTEHDDQLTLF